MYLIRVLWTAALMIAVFAGEAAAVQDPTPPNAPRPDDRVLLRDAVEAILESDLRTPAAQTRAILQLADLGAVQDAQRLLEALRAANLDEQALARLARDVGAPALLRLARAESLQPAGGELVEQALGAADKLARDPQLLAMRIAELRDPDPNVRSAAVKELRDGQSDAVVMLIAALAATESAEHRQAIENAVVAMGPLAVGPLIAMLMADEEALQITAIHLLDRLDANQAGIYLLAPAAAASQPALRQTARQVLQRLRGGEPAPDPAQTLRRQVERDLAGETYFPVDQEGFIEIWGWDLAGKKPFSRRRTAREAGIIRASQLARGLIQIRPHDMGDGRLYWVAQLEAAKIEHGFDHPLPDGIVRQEAARAGIKMLEEVLSFAMPRNNVGAAVAAAELLGDLGTADLVLSLDGQPRPLSRALEHGDRRVRFAAVAAIMKLNPRHPFPGSSRVAENLGILVATASSRRALIGCPRAGEGQDLAGLLIPLGYEAEVATQGRQLFQMATTGGEVELLLIYFSLERPAPRELLYLLRRDPLTARVPIGLLTTVDDLPRAKSLAEDHQRVVAFPRPHTPEALAEEVEILLQQVGSTEVAEKTRLEQGLRAIQWLGQLAASTTGAYDLRRQWPKVEAALFNPALTAAATEALSHAHAPGSQRALVDLASQANFPLAKRQAAAIAFRKNILLHGVLLTSEEIDRQYDRYNQSETADRPTQLLLGSILDSIEHAEQLRQGRPLPK